jgi:hypothetical protein
MTLGVVLVRVSDAFAEEVGRKDKRKKSRARPKRSDNGNMVGGKVGGKSVSLFSLFACVEDRGLDVDFDFSLLTRWKLYEVNLFGAHILKETEQILHQTPLVWRFGGVVPTGQPMLIFV